MSTTHLNGTHAQHASVVTDSSFVTCHYRLRLADGQDFVSTFGDRPATVQLGTGQLAPGIEALMIGLLEGAHESFEVLPAQAYGDRNPDLIQRVSRKLLDQQSTPGESYQPGDIVEFPAPNGGRYTGVLKSIDHSTALFDFNHPLAGQTLTFDVQIIGVL